MFKHILIPTDGSERSENAIRYGMDLAKVHGARVTVIHVVPDFHLMIAYEGAFDPATEEKIEREALAKAEGYLASAKKVADEVGVSCESVRATSDHPYDEICKTAEQRGCDLILMTSHGRRSIMSMLLGSETRKVLSHASVPVLVVR
ncbi:MAG: universal stress protein [Acidobacteria bacterium]|nr:universal stress protein [Acidobacteriota bacterium]